MPGAKHQKTVALTGATGFVGTYLQKTLTIKGWKVIPLGRIDFQCEESVLAKKIAGVEVIINLAGAPVLGRWTESFKKNLYDSRITLTTKLVRAISLMEKKPEAFLSASAIGIYASEGDHTEENNYRADTFLGNLAGAWEDAALAAESLGVRATVLRLGVVLGKDGGALQKMLPAFKLGVGGTIGSGKQAFSWIHLEDLTKVFETVISDQSCRGIYNVTAPEPATNRELTKELGRILSRPTILPVPEFVLNILFGEGAQILTTGQKVYPKRLLDAGFSFKYPTLNSALKACLA
nr:TIGR01777 family protein [Desulfobulbaceae bacterium]